MGQASRLPLGRLAPVISQARRPFIAGRRPAPLFFRQALSSHYYIAAQKFWDVQDTPHPPYGHPLPSEGRGMG